MKPFLLILSLSLCSCSTVIPPNTSVTGKSGKQVATVEVGGQTVRDGFKKLGITILQMFVKSAVTYGLDAAGERLNLLSGRSGK